MRIASPNGPRQQDKTASQVLRGLITSNEDAGIFYEISYGLHAHDNVIVNNGLADTAGAWGANAGISISSSPDCVIERSLLIGNKEGFNFREQARSTSRIDSRRSEPVWNHDSTIRGNSRTKPGSKRSAAIYRQRLLMSYSK